RIIPTAEAQLSRRTTDAIVADLVHRLALPTDRAPRAAAYPPRTAVPPPATPSSPYDPRRREAVREGLRGLTGRGRGFLYGAAPAALSALILGEKDFLRVAVLLAILPLLAAWHVGRSRYRLACQRSLDPARVQVGMTARVLLRLENLSNFTTGTLLL